jgi:hypothetical protein
VRNVLCCVSAAIALACVSCAKIYPVSGKVTYNGAPASGATVFFFRQGGDRGNEPAILSIVQQDGTFELVCGSLGKGAPPGEYDVLIEWKPKRVRSQGRRQPGPDDILKGRYADRKRPLLHVAVEARATNVANFELTNGAAIQIRPSRGRQ